MLWISFSRSLRIISISSFIVYLSLEIISSNDLAFILLSIFMPLLISIMLQLIIVSIEMLVSLSSLPLIFIEFRHKLHPVHSFLSGLSQFILHDLWLLLKLLHLRLLFANHWYKCRFSSLWFKLLLLRLRLLRVMITSQRWKSLKFINDWVNYVHHTFELSHIQSFLK